MHPIRYNVGAYIKTDIKSHSPAANSAGTRNGAAIEIGATRSIVITANVGATSGTPDNFSVAYKLQDSLDGSTFADVANASDATLTVTTASTAGELDVDLSRFCRQEATHFRFLETVAFTGGTSPTVLAGSTVTRGPGQSLPL
jgi:hypothetical protein